MTLADIYQWIVDNFPYYRVATTGWKVGLLMVYIYYLPTELVNIIGSHLNLTNIEETYSIFYYVVDVLHVQIS